jgi:hypothetical protein
MMNIILLAVFCVISLQVQADFGAVTTGTAGSGRAAVEATEAPSLNPAAISYMHGYFFNSGYSALATGNSFSASFTDNLPDTMIPSSLMYRQSNIKTAAKKDWTVQDFHFSAANFLGDNFSLGFAFNHRIDSLNNNKYAQTNMSVGTIADLTPALSLAFVFDNIADPQPDTPQDLRLKPGTSVGLSYNFRRFLRLRLDLESPSGSNSFSHPTVSTGLESYFNRWLVLRLGARKETEAKLDRYGGGLSFIGPKFAIHYGYLNSPQDENETRHAVDLAIPIW